MRPSDLLDQQSGAEEQRGEHLRVGEQVDEGADLHAVFRRQVHIEPRFQHRNEMATWPLMSEVEFIGPERKIFFFLGLGRLTFGSCHVDPLLETRGSVVVTLKDQRFDHRMKPTSNALQRGSACSLSDRSCKTRCARSGAPRARASSATPTASRTASSDESWSSRDRPRMEMRCSSGSKACSPLARVSVRANSAVPTALATSPASSCVSAVSHQPTEAARLLPPVMSVVTANSGPCRGLGPSLQRIHGGQEQPGQVLEVTEVVGTGQRNRLFEMAPAGSERVPQDLGEPGTGQSQAQAGRTMQRSGQANRVVDVLADQGALPGVRRGGRGGAVGDDAVVGSETVGQVEKV